ncbi:hypothetical protein, partial [Pseudomonas poae]|uniref:hypothetical protein n=1 Tax=Pseudomonas poae TaxID=200451 RepID=UPI0034D6D0CC
MVKQSEKKTLPRKALGSIQLGNSLRYTTITVLCLQLCSNFTLNQNGEHVDGQMLTDFNDPLY